MPASGSWISTGPTTSATLSPCAFFIDFAIVRLRGIQSCESRDHVSLLLQHARSSHRLPGQPAAFAPGGTLFSARRLRMLRTISCTSAKSATLDSSHPSAGRDSGQPATISASGQSAASRGKRRLAQRRPQVPPQLLGDEWREGVQQAQADIQDARQVDRPSVRGVPRPASAAWRSPRTSRRTPTRRSHRSGDRPRRIERSGTAAPRRAPVAATWPRSMSSASVYSDSCAAPGGRLSMAEITNRPAFQILLAKLRLASTFLTERFVIIPRGRAHQQREAQRVRAQLIHHVQRVDHVAVGLGHLAAVLVADQAVQVHRVERHLAR